jgi:hypothetical protein
VSLRTHRVNTDTSYIQEPTQEASIHRPLKETILQLMQEEISLPLFEPQNIECRMLNVEVLTRLLRFCLQYSAVDGSS